MPEDIIYRLERLRKYYEVGPGSQTMASKEQLIETRDVFTDAINEIQLLREELNDLEGNNYRG